MHGILTFAMPVWFPIILETRRSRHPNVSSHVHFNDLHLWPSSKPKTVVLVICNHFSLSSQDTHTASDEDTESGIWINRFSTYCLSASPLTSSISELTAVSRLSGAGPCISRQEADTSMIVLVLGRTPPALRRYCRVWSSLWPMLPHWHRYWDTGENAQWSDKVQIVSPTEGQCAQFGHCTRFSMYQYKVHFSQVAVSGRSFVGTTCGVASDKQ